MHVPPETEENNKRLRGRTSTWLQRQVEHLIVSPDNLVFWRIPVVLAIVADIADIPEPWFVAPCAFIVFP